MKTVLLLILLAGNAALAETATMLIKGMHCEGCVETIKSKVCGNMKELNSCVVSLIDAKKKIGKLEVSGDKIDVAAIKKLVDEVGYSITETRTK